MSCYYTVDANGTITRNYVGDGTITILEGYGSASGGSYVAPCDGSTAPGYVSAPTPGQHSTAGVPEPGCLALLAFGLVVLGMTRASRRGILDLNSAESVLFHDSAACRGAAAFSFEGYA